MADPPIARRGLAEHPLSCRDCGGWPDPLVAVQCTTDEDLGALFRVQAGLLSEHLHWEGEEGGREGGLKARRGAPPYPTVRGLECKAGVVGQRDDVLQALLMRDTWARANRLQTVLLLRRLNFHKSRVLQRQAIHRRRMLVVLAVGVRLGIGARRSQRHDDRCRNASPQHPPQFRWHLCHQEAATAQGQPAALPAAVLSQAKPRRAPPRFPAVACLPHERALQGPQQRPAGAGAGPDHRAPVRKPQCRGASFSLGNTEVPADRLQTDRRESTDQPGSGYIPHESSSMRYLESAVYFQSSENLDWINSYRTGTLYRTARVVHATRRAGVKLRMTGTSY